MAENKNELYLKAKKVLEQNSRDGYTVPSIKLYPHQWLWDSCFIAIGLRHYNITKAKQELLSLKRSQWKNGMLPNIIFYKGGLNIDGELWESQLNKYAPEHVKTSGITQPPMLAEAVYKVGEKLTGDEKSSFYSEMIGCLVRYHQWLYQERDPYDTGLISLVHPYESGLDNSPTWLFAVNNIRFPWWIRMIRIKNFKKFINYFRRDTTRVAEKERISFHDAVEYFYIIKKLKKYRYDSKKILRKSRPIIEDLGFNSILVNTNRRLRMIAQEIGYTLPKDLTDKISLSEKSFNKFWDEKNRQYYSRYPKSGSLIKKQTIESLLPVYSGAISDNKVEDLLVQLNDKQSFNTPFSVPSVPINSRYFDADNFWQGPVWINTNWLIIQGLENYGLHKEAERLKRKTLRMIDEAGFYEYFSPLDGKGKGAPDFSWTAALIIDLLES